MDGDVAELARMVAISGGIKKPGGGHWSPTDFCNWGEPPEAEPLTDDQVLSLFAAFAKPKDT